MMTSSSWWWLLKQPMSSYWQLAAGDDCKELSTVGSNWWLIGASVDSWQRLMIANSSWWQLTAGEGSKHLMITSRQLESTHNCLKFFFIFVLDLKYKNGGWRIGCMDPGPNVIKLFTAIVSNACNKLECFSLASLFSEVYCLIVRL